MFVFQVGCCLTMFVYKVLFIYLFFQLVGTEFDGVELLVSNLAMFSNHFHNFLGSSKHFFISMHCG